MKKSVLSALAVLFGVTIGFAQQAPADVQKTFTDKYPEATSVEWEKEGADGWEVEFKMKEKEMSAEFDAKGTWLKTETEIDMSELPEGVMEAIKSRFEGYTADEVEMVEPADGEVAYEVEFEKGKEELEVLFSFDGTVLNKRQEDPKK